jgi:hypothetical protein
VVVAMDRGENNMEYVNEKLTTRRKVLSGDMGHIA